MVNTSLGKGSAPNTSFIVSNRLKKSMCVQNFYNGSFFNKNRNDNANQKIIENLVFLYQDSAPLNSIGSVGFF